MARKLQLELDPRKRIRTELLDVIGERLETHDEEGHPAADGLRHHWVAFALGAGWWVAAVGLIVALVLTNGRVELVLLSFFMAARGSWLLLSTYEDRFVVTDMRILRIQGVLNQRTAAMSLSRIVDFTLEQPLLGQLLGYGHLVFENAAQDQGLRVIRFIPDADEVHKQIQLLVFEAGGGPGRHKGGPPPGDLGPAPYPGDLDATGEIPAVR